MNGTLINTGQNKDKNGTHLPAGQAGMTQIQLIKADLFIKINNYLKIHFVIH